MMGLQCPTNTLQEYEHFFHEWLLISVVFTDFYYLNRTQTY